LYILDAAATCQGACALGRQSLLQGSSR
jgi:hypothetical protein